LFSWLNELPHSTMQPRGNAYSSKENLHPRRTILSGREPARPQSTASPGASACHQNSSGNGVAGNDTQCRQLQPPAPSLNGSASNAPQSTQSEDSILAVSRQPLSQVSKPNQFSQLQSSSQSQSNSIKVHFNGFQYRPDPASRTGLRLLPKSSASVLGKPSSITNGLRVRKRSI